MPEFIGLNGTYFIKLGIVIFILILFFYYFNKSEKKLEKKKYESKILWEKAFNTIPDFKPTHYYGTVLSNTTIGFDDKRKKICFFTIEKDYFIYSYEKILQCEIVIDGEIYLKQSTTNVIGRAIVGGLLTGGIGMIIGGVTGSKKQKQIINSIDLKIIINDINNPVFIVNFFIGQINKNSPEYKKVYAEIEKWHAIVSGLIQSANNKS